MDCRVQIFLDGRWKTAAVFEPDTQKIDKGIAGGGRLQYDIDYAVAYLGNRAAELIPGLTVGFELFRFEQWPPFLVDLLPGGAGRRAWLRRMQAENDGPQMDWHLLTKGAGTPPGNLRIAEAVLTPPPDHFKFGFPRKDIIEQRERFLDYAEERGAHVAGASSVQGEAPKYLIAEDQAGMFHAEGALPDEKIKQFWLVKFPRGSRTDKRNQQVLSMKPPTWKLPENLAFAPESLWFMKMTCFLCRVLIARYRMVSLNVWPCTACMPWPIYQDSGRRFVTMLTASLWRKSSLTPSRKCESIYVATS